MDLKMGKKEIIYQNRKEYFPKAQSEFYFYKLLNRDYQPMFKLTDKSKEWKLKSRTAKNLEPKIRIRTKPKYLKPEPE